MRTGENIYKRKDGRWEARYHKGRDRTGKLVYGFCYGKTYSEAKAKMEYAKQHASHLTFCPSNKEPMLEQVCHEWINFSRVKLKKSTIAKYQSAIDKYIIPLLGEYTISRITSEIVSSFGAELLEHCALSPKTAKDILVLLHSILAYGSREYLHSSNVVEMSYPRCMPKEMRVLSRQEQKKLTDFLLTDLSECKLGILLALWTGIRIGELCALRWEHVSLENRVVKIEKTMLRIPTTDSEAPGKTIVITEDPKTASSARLIPIGSFTVELCHRVNPGNKEAYILTGTEKYMEPRTLQYRFKQYTEICGLQDVTFHTLRHTFATRCIEVDFEVKSLSEILGHANTSITMNRYVHSSLELKRDNIQKLDFFHL